MVVKTVEQNVKKIYEKNHLPGLCPQRKKGKHWRNEYKSKLQKDVIPLNDEEQNIGRGACSVA